MKKLLVSALFFAYTVPVTWADTLSVHVVKQPDRKWFFQRFNAISDDSSTRVIGRLSASKRYGLPSGHVDVAAYTPGGELLAETTSNDIPGTLTYRMKRKGGLRFFATFNQKLPPEAIVKVAFHRPLRHHNAPPSHNNNIAR